MPGCLNVVSIPIGNERDITLRALDSLKDCDAVICEEVRPAETFLKKHGIRKPLFPLNEHNETEHIGEYADLVAASSGVCLISDAGTPAFADPGRKLINHCRDRNIPINVFPGCCSVITALSICGFDINRFHYAGFPPREKSDRSAFLKNLSRLDCPVVIMDTPYRLSDTLAQTAAVFPKDARATLCMDLTKNTEKVTAGKLCDIASTLNKFKKTKAEFVLVINPANAKTIKKHRRA